jgi:probable F420-dependent oxidoreductase
MGIQSPLCPIFPGGLSGSRNRASVPPSPAEPQETLLKFGLFGINMVPCDQPVAAARIARAAEGAGFESLWTGEHVVLPDPQAPPSPVPPDTPFLDPAVALAYVAAHTSTIRLGTGIIILPQRNPLVLAKELASLDVLSNGRLIFGVGIGYLRAEFDALGIPFEDKAARSIEYLRSILNVWTETKPAFSGRFVSFGGIQAMPRPVQQPHPPIVFGGMSPEGFRRAVRYANGWYGYALDLEGTAACVRGLREAEERTERPAALGPIEISVTPRGHLDIDTVRRFADLGVDRLIPYRPRVNEAGLHEFIDRVGTELIPVMSRER